MKELNKLQHTEIFLLSFLKAFSPFILHQKLKRNSRFTLRKKGWSHHHTIHHFSAITLLFCCVMNHALKKGQSSHKPCTTFTPSRQLFCCFTNQAQKTSSRQTVASASIESLLRKIMRMFPLNNTLQDWHFLKGLLQ